MKERFDDFKEMVKDNPGAFVCLVLTILVAIGTIIAVIWAANCGGSSSGDSMGIANPANPASPLNPANPANPIKHMH